jgi:hypothetical protein
MPVYDPDAEKPTMTDADAILIGISRIRDPGLLRRYGERWAEEIRQSGRRDEVELAYRNRMRALTR